MVSLLGYVEIIVGVLTSLGLIAGFLYWVISRTVGIATKKYVDDQVSRLERDIGETKQLAEDNSESIEGVEDLIEGGNSRFQKGMMDYLDKNIERTNDIREDLDGIREELRDQSDD